MPDPAQFNTDAPIGPVDDHLQQPADQHVCSTTIVELGALMTDPSWTRP